MPVTSVRIYPENDGSVPLHEWLDKQSNKVQDKCIVLIERLQEKGYELRRPACDFLEDGIYELRARHGNVNYRILYCYVGQCVVLLSHGCTKTDKVPKRDIREAISHREDYLRNPEKHTYEEVES